jgi:hypothetical protein
LAVDILGGNPPLLRIQMKFTMMAAFLENGKAMKVARYDLIPDLVVETRLFFRLTNVEEMTPRTLPVPGGFRMTESGNH